MTVISYILYFTSVIVFMTAPVYAVQALPFELTQYACHKAIESHLKKYQSATRWKRVASPAWGVLAWRTPSKEMGRWLELQMKDHASLFVIEPTTTRVYRWELKNCSLILASQSKALVNSKTTGPKVFTDKIMGELTNAQHETMIYFWSTYSVISQNLLSVYRAVAESVQLKFVAINVDSRATTKSASELQTEYSASQSVEVLMRVSDRSWPSVMLVGNGKFSEVITGASELTTIKSMVLDEQMNMRIRRYE